MRAAIIKRRLGVEKNVLIDILYQGFALNHSNIDLIYFLFPLLLKEDRPKEALEVLETYIVDNQNDPRINMEIIRLLTIHPSPEVNDPEAAREYIAWYLNNLGDKNIEVFILLATADIQLIKNTGADLYDEAWSAINRAEGLDASPVQMETVRQLRAELLRLR